MLFALSAINHTARNWSPAAPKGTTHINISVYDLLKSIPKEELILREQWKKEATGILYPQHKKHGASEHVPRSMEGLSLTGVTWPLLRSAIEDGFNDAKLWAEEGRGRGGRIRLAVAGKLLRSPTLFYDPLGPSRDPPVLGPSGPLTTFY